MKYRSDIDGLRAIAVLAVICYHAFPLHMTGGFIGVDVFFVISGYLISNIIIQKLDSAEFSFTEFYKHRIKRIFPALILILLTCIASGWFLLLPEEYEQLGYHVAGASTFVSNFILASESGYFNNVAESKILLHLWSLAIEEQFYLAWPILLCFFWRINHRFVILILISIFFSYLFNIKETNLDKNIGFFLPQVRFFEMALGGLLAYFEINNNPHRDSVKNIASILGYSILIYGFLEIDQNFKYPGQWVLVPVFGALLIIYAGPKSFLNKLFLSKKPIVYVGLISYSLYLWHWPLLSLFRIVNGENANAIDASTIIFISLILSILTYHFIERPFRVSTSSITTPLLIISLLLTGALGYVTYKMKGFPKRTEVYESNNEQRKPPKMLENVAFCKSILPEYNGDCASSSNELDLSEFDIVFFGDSHARALAMDLILSPNKSHSLLIGKNGCPPLSGVDRFNYKYAYGCEKYYNKAIDVFKSHDFTRSTLIYTMYFTAYFTGDGISPEGKQNMSNGGVHIQPTGEKQDNSFNLYASTFTSSFDKTLKDLSPLFRNIIIVLQPPELLVSAEKCVQRPYRSIIDDNCRSPKHVHLGRQAAYRDVIKKNVSSYKNIIIYDPMKNFCDEEFCYAIPKTAMLYRDDNHIGLLGSKTILNDMATELHGFFTK